MDLILYPTKLHGRIAAIPSKSHVHRLLICAAFSDKPTSILCPQASRDMDATAQCLRSLGARITYDGACYQVDPVKQLPQQARLCCGESGSTLRFLLPVVGALGIEAQFITQGRLSQRPLSPLWEEMERMGCHLMWKSPHTLHCSGKLRSGNYRIAGNISSQFISGLLLAFVLMPEGGSITVTGALESKPYVDITVQTLRQFGVVCHGLSVGSGSILISPGVVSAEGDWSNSAYFLAANSLGSRIEVTGLNPLSLQGDRISTSLLNQLRGHFSVDAAQIPDLVPILAVVAAARQGACFRNVSRLRLKESDRIASTVKLLQNLGGLAEADENTLTVYGTGLTGGITDAFADHRIAMAAAIASTVCALPVIVLGAECVEKSYPQFWADFAWLGGIHEQYIR